MTRQINLNEDAVNEVFKFYAGQSDYLQAVIGESTQALATEQIEWVVPVNNNTVHKIECLWLLAEETGCTLKLEKSADLSARNEAFLEDILQAKATENASSMTRSFKLLCEYISFAIDCLRLLYNKSLASLNKQPISIANRYDTAALIGVYGFEHVGDIGILAGVLLRVHEKFGVKQVKLFSINLEYTQRLAAELDTPVTLTVFPAIASVYKNELPDCDAVFWGGWATDGFTQSFVQEPVRHLFHEKNG